MGPGGVYSQSSYLHCARSSLSPNWRPLILLSHSATHFQHPTLKMTWKKNPQLSFSFGKKKKTTHSGNFFIFSKEKENCFSLALKHKKRDATNQWCKEEENPPEMRNNTSGGREVLLFFSAQRPREWWITACHSYKSGSTRSLASSIERSYRRRWCKDHCIDHGNARLLL